MDFRHGGESAAAMSSSANDFGPMLAYSAEGFDFTARDMSEHDIQLLERGVAFDGIEIWRLGLDKNQRLAHSLFAGGKIDQQWISTAALGSVMSGGDTTAEPPARRRVGEVPEELFERPVNQVHECVRVRERGRDGFEVQQSRPSLADVRRSKAQCVHQRFLHDRHYARSRTWALRTAWRTLRVG